MKRSHILLLVPCLAAAAVIARLATGATGAGPAPAGAAARAPALPEIRFADAIDTPTSMPGHRSRNTATDGILMHVVESLVAPRADFSIAPMLADSWTVSPDGRTYRFQLRHGVTFHNGAPMTSAEVKWSVERMLDPKAELACRSQYDGSKGARVVKVEAPAPDVVSIELAEPSALFLAQMWNLQCPLAILHPDSVDAQGKWIAPVGTGPYRFGTWRKGQFVALTRYEGYLPRAEPASGLAGAKVAKANLRFVVIPDASAQKAAFMSGQVDLIVADGDSPPPRGPNWEVVVEHDLDTNALLMQSRDPLMARLAFRRAVALALDLPALAKALSNGHAGYNPSLVPEVSPYHTAAHAAGYRRDAAQVAQLLAQAGYRGETLKIQTNKRYPELYRLAVVAQNMLNRAGIRAEVEVLEWATQVSNFREGRFQMMAFSYSSRIEPALMYGDVLGDKAVTPMSQWTDPEASALLAGIREEADPARRQLVFDELHRRMVAAVPMIELYNTAVLFGVSRHLSGFQTWPLRRPRFFNVSKRG
jgi:peptide/nickel transport system substrate-binding protein